MIQAATTQLNTNLSPNTNLKDFLKRFLNLLSIRVIMGLL